MSDIVVMKNIAALVTARLAAPFGPLTAGGAGNNVAVTGAGFDRAALKMPLSAAMVLLWSAQLGAGNTLAFNTVKVQHSSDNQTWADYATLPVTGGGVVATGPAGGGAVSGATEFAINLAGANQYVRLAYTPTLSAANTDTATATALFIFAGFDRLPAPA